MKAAIQSTFTEHKYLSNHYEKANESINKACNAIRDLLNDFDNKNNNEKIEIFDLFSQEIERIKSKKGGLRDNYLRLRWEILELFRLLPNEIKTRFIENLTKDEVNVYLERLSEASEIISENIEKLNKKTLFAEAVLENNNNVINSFEEFENYYYKLEQNIAKLYSNIDKNIKNLKKSISDLEIQPSTVLYALDIIYHSVEKIGKQHQQGLKLALACLLNTMDLYSIAANQDASEYSKIFRSIKSLIEKEKNDINDLVNGIYSYRLIEFILQAATNPVNLESHFNNLIEHELKTAIGLNKPGDLFLNAGALKTFNDRIDYIKYEINGIQTSEKLENALSQLKENSDSKDSPFSLLNYLTELHPNANQIIQEISNRYSLDIQKFNSDDEELLQKKSKNLAKLLNNIDPKKLDNDTRQEFSILLNVKDYSKNKNIPNAKKRLSSPKLTKKNSLSIDITSNASIDKNIPLIRTRLATLGYARNIPKNHILTSKTNKIIVQNLEQNLAKVNEILVEILNINEKSEKVLLLQTEAIRLQEITNQYLSVIQKPYACNELKISIDSLISSLYRVDFPEKCQAEKLSKEDIDKVLHNAEAGSILNELRCVITKKYAEYQNSDSIEHQYYNNLIKKIDEKESGITKNINHQTTSLNYGQVQEQATVFKKLDPKSDSFTRIQDTAKEQYRSDEGFSERYSGSNFITIIKDEKQHLITALNEFRDNLLKLITSNQNNYTLKDNIEIKPHKDFVSESITIYPHIVENTINYTLNAFKHFETISNGEPSNSLYYKLVMLRMIEICGEASLILHKYIVNTIDSNKDIHLYRLRVALYHIGIDDLSTYKQLINFLCPQLETQSPVINDADHTNIDELIFRFETTLLFLNHFEASFDNFYDEQSDAFVLAKDFCITYFGQQMRILTANTWFNEIIENIEILKKDNHQLKVNSAIYAVKSHRNYLAHDAITGIQTNRSIQFSGQYNYINFELKPVLTALWFLSVFHKQSIKSNSSLSQLDQMHIFIKESIYRFENCLDIKSHANDTRQIDSRVNTVINELMQIIPSNAAYGSDPEFKSACDRLFSGSLNNTGKDRKGRPTSLAHIGLFQLKSLPIEDDDQNQSLKLLMQ